MLSYPSDEVGNHLIDLDIMDEKNVNPWSDVLTEEKYRELFGYEKHVFTGVDYVEYYKQLIQELALRLKSFSLTTQKLSFLIQKVFLPVTFTLVKEQNVF